MSYLPWALPAALALAGCAGVEPCRPGFDRAEDGHCYPPPTDPSPPSVTDVLLGMGPCVPSKPGTAIDLVTGCLYADDPVGASPSLPGCPGDSFDTVDVAWGRGADCVLNGSGTVWTCDWDPGLEAVFDAEDSDTVQPSGAATTDWVRARSAFTGADPDGLGMGISVRCWVDVLGPPTAAEFVDDPIELAVDELYWDPLGIDVLDTQRADGTAVPDGLADVLTLYGPP